MIEEDDHQNTPREKKTCFFVRLDKDVVDWLDKNAAETDDSRSRFLNEIARRAMDGRAEVDEARRELRTVRAKLTTLEKKCGSLVEATRELAAASKKLLRANEEIEADNKHLRRLVRAAVAKGASPYDDSKYFRDDTRSDAENEEN